MDLFFSLSVCLIISRIIKDIFVKYVREFCLIFAYRLLFTESDFFNDDVVVYRVFHDIRA